MSHVTCHLSLSFGSLIHHLHTIIRKETGEGEEGREREREERGREGKRGEERGREGKRGRWEHGRDKGGWM